MWDSTFLALKLLPTRGCKSLWKSYATEIIPQPADASPCAWKCGTDGAVLSVGITYQGRVATYKNAVSV